MLFIAAFSEQLAVESGIAIFLAWRIDREITGNQEIPLQFVSYLQTVGYITC